MNTNRPIAFSAVAFSALFLTLAAFPGCKRADTAAAQGVLEGAGGEVMNLRGEALTYEARESFLNPSFLALPQAA